MRKLIPPSPAVPSLLPPCETAIFIFVFAKHKWPIEMEYIEQGVIIEDVD
jgi:hypothetical protein